MDPKELRNLQEAYMDVYNPERLDEISQQLKTRAFKSRATREFESDGDNPSDFTKSGASKADQTKANIVKKHGGTAGAHAERAAHAGIFGRKSSSMPKKPVEEGYDLYDLVLSHLLDEGYADTYEAAESIMVNMSEDWRESIIEEYVDEASVTDDRVRRNQKAFGSNYTPPRDWDPSANRGKGAVLNAKQKEKQRRKGLRQEEYVDEGFKEIDRAKHGRMYDRYKNLRTAAMKDAEKYGEATGTNRSKMGKMSSVIDKSAQNLRNKG